MGRFVQRSTGLCGHRTLLGSRQSRQSERNSDLSGNFAFSKRFHVFAVLTNGEPRCPRGTQLPSEPTAISGSQLPSIHFSESELPEPVDILAARIPTLRVS